MLSFTQYLAEKFLKGIEGVFGYVEIYKNPTKSELRQVNNAVPGNIYGYEKYGPVSHYLGAVVAGKDLYVFDRAMAVHFDIKQQILKRAGEWLPLYIYYFPSSDTAVVSIAAYSADTHQKHMANEHAVERVKKLASFQVFKNIVPEGDDD